MGVRSTTVSVQLLVHVALYIQYARALYRAWGGRGGGGGGEDGQRAFVQSRGVFSEFTDHYRMSSFWPSVIRQCRAAYTCASMRIPVLVL